MENHAQTSVGAAIYTAETVKHALQYAFPCNVLGDNLYYSVLLNLEVKRADILKKCNKGEVLIRPGGSVIIRAVTFFFNIDISKGYPRSYTWDPDLELLPVQIKRDRNIWLSDRHRAVQKFRKDSWCT